MKTKIFSVILIILITTPVFFAQQLFSFFPAQPSYGDMLTINFNAEKTKLENEKNIDVIIYSIKKDKGVCREYPMTKSETGWSCKYQIPDSSWCLGIKFTNGKIEVDNLGKIFPILLYDKNGMLLKGTRAACAYLCLNGNVNVRVDGKYAYQLFDEEFEENPSLLRYFLSTYAVCIKTLDKEIAETKINGIISKVEKEKDLDEDVLSDIIYIYSNILKNPVKSDQYNALIKKKYPSGRTAQSSDALYIINFKNNNGIDSLENLINKFQLNYGDNNGWVHLLRNKLFKSYCERRLYLKAKEFFRKHTEELMGDLLGIGQVSYAAKLIFDYGEELNFSKELIDIALNSIQNFSPEKSTSTEYTRRQIKANIERYKFEILYYAALIYEKTGALQEAVKFVEEDNVSGKSTDELQILHARLLLKLGKEFDFVTKTTERLISSGIISDEIISVNKEVYVQTKGSEKGYEEYLSLLKKSFIDSLKEEINRNMINKEAPAFTLMDLEGKAVKLSDLKGKIVILDFWATWCSFCTDSFPQMKKAIEKYANDKNIVFLFVDTKERKQDQKEKAKKFIEEKGYPFRVLLDTENKVSEAFNVQGIPVKIFIDKNGNQRFASVGFYKEKLSDEIDILIELLK